MQQIDIIYSLAERYPQALGLARDVSRSLGRLPIGPRG